MSKRSWADSYRQTIACLKTTKQGPLRIAIAGIGHELRGDDAAGLVIARHLASLNNDHLLVIEAGHAPENHTGRLRQFAPDLILLVDSAQLDEPPGAIRWLPWAETSGLSASSHTLPPYMLARYLTTELNCEVALIGIQPQNTALAAPLSPAVQEAVTEVAEAIASLLSTPQNL
jgi:hydrogenase 3 maturation protease